MEQMNIVFLGTFPYPRGMAGTKRIQHAIDGLRKLDNVSLGVVILRQSTKLNVLAGTHDGVRYETIMGDLLRGKAAMMAPIFYVRALQMIRKVFRADMKNILYVYGPPSLDNLPSIWRARKLGFKVVFDIVEDHDLAWSLCTSLWGHISNVVARLGTRRIVSIADGIVVITSHLKRKFLQLTSGNVPIHLRPISVDLDRFSSAPQHLKDPVTLFYGGGFGPQNGVDNLVKAFEILIERGFSLRLHLTGPDKGNQLETLLSLCRNAASRRQIKHFGYLDDERYYHALSQADIPCVPRTDIGYAHAGFPFKLGEYLATGKPVVVSAVSDVCRFVENLQHAVIVEPGSVESLTKGIHYLITHPDKASAIGERGRLAAREFFDYTTQALRLHTFLRSLFFQTDNKR